MYLCYSVLTTPLYDDSLLIFAFAFFSFFFLLFVLGGCGCNLHGDKLLFTGSFHILIPHTLFWDPRIIYPFRLTALNGFNNFKLFLSIAYGTVGSTHYVGALCIGYSCLVFGDWRTAIYTSTDYHSVPSYWDAIVIQYLNRFQITSTMTLCKTCIQCLLADSSEVISFDIRSSPTWHWRGIYSNWWWRVGPETMLSWGEPTLCINLPAYGICNCSLSTCRKLLRRG